MLINVISLKYVELSNCRIDWRSFRINILNLINLLTVSVLVAVLYLLNMKKKTEKGIRTQNKCKVQGPLRNSLLKIHMKGDNKIPVH